MSNLNTALDKLFTSDQHYWIYCDGSCDNTAHDKTGSYAANVRMPDGSIQLVAGTASHTTNNRMELLALNAALHAQRH